MSKSEIKHNIFTERNRSGDVAERTLWVIKRGIRSGSGQNLVSVSEQQILGTATGYNGAPHTETNKNQTYFKFNNIRRDIEVVITALTRNQVYSNVPRVRIPLSPP